MNDHDDKIEQLIFSQENNRSPTRADEEMKGSEESFGVLLRTIKPGDGTNFPKKGDTCRVHYEGFLENKTKFDSSRSRNQSFCFPLGVGAVIKGWDISIGRMSRGQVAYLTIPAMLGYGEFGHPPIIPGGSSLLFEIELIDFMSP
mmetsp:Transcript_32232/g.47419  ORF Transcript_32232/g.47419 Transcript_32232/m.47419 type:complete len:145 (+) Transcript_32232:229-663(+)|eukprot:CAMPEP_0195518830 /NCGR_PEP_ID=MMETSP0794_2-20130614/13755_1 /TAXON_ID=515487 /ORGANISM="Stephanopyxis turris, Strain CCMP 815" /LENGTH=144 /DNA_ID=CAMNT_0040647859 /DNA_START=229 /DNA_END=663 /DNA_ORIENTATION=-